MPTKILDYDHFIYVLYAKKAQDDIIKFKAIMNVIIDKYSGGKDLIIDLTQCHDLIPPEITLIVKSVLTIEKAKRYVRIVAGERILRILKSNKLANRPHVALYENVEQFAKEIKQAQGKKIEAAPTEGTSEVVFEGRLSGSAVNDMVEKTKDALKGAGQRIVMNFDKVEYLDSMCIGQLMYLDGVAKDFNKKLALSGLNEEILQLFQETNMDQLFEIVGS